MERIPFFLPPSATSQYIIEGAKLQIIQGPNALTAVIPFRIPMRTPVV
jgi:hypothetical protein